MRGQAAWVASRSHHGRRILALSRERQLAEGLAISVSGSELASGDRVVAAWARVERLRAAVRRAEEVAALRGANLSGGRQPAAARTGAYPATERRER